MARAYFIQNSVRAAGRLPNFPKRNTHKKNDTLKLLPIGGVGFCLYPLCDTHRLCRVEKSEANSWRLPSSLRVCALRGVSLAALC